MGGGTLTTDLRDYEDKYVNFWLSLIISSSRNEASLSFYGGCFALGNNHSSFKHS